MVAYVQNFGGTSWSLSVNCTSFVSGMARAGGINISQNITNFGYDDPNKLGSWLSTLK